MLNFVKDVLDPLSLGPNAPFGEHRVTFGDLAWATAAVSSRAFTHLYGEWRQESKPLLVPFMDMVNFNHDKSNVQVRAGHRMSASLLRKAPVLRYFDRCPLEQRNDSEAVTTKGGIGVKDRYRYTQ